MYPKATQDFLTIIRVAQDASGAWKTTKKIAVAFANVWETGSLMTVGNHLERTKIQVVITSPEIRRFLDIQKPRNQDTQERNFRRATRGG
jgi:hypothetical protein